MVDCSTNDRGMTGYFSFLIYINSLPASSTDDDDDDDDDYDDLCGKQFGLIQSPTKRHM